MSLFDFVKNIGNSLFNSEDDAAGKIKEHIEADNPGIDQLDVVFQKGFVTLRGSSQTWEAVEKAILMAGNVKGVEKVVSEIVVGEGAGAPPGELAGATGGGAGDGPDVEYYVIKSGDTLSHIAKHFYGDANQYPKIFEANREVIKHPDKIFPGQKIRIPKG